MKNKSPAPSSQSLTSAFTLVELSIVLAVIGLLIGGVLGAQSMLRQARVKGVQADVLRYQQAAKSFKDRYKLLPGDLTNATILWGAAHATPATCYDTNSAGSISTCNGDGDSTIDTYNETFRFWQQLSNAMMIEGYFTGTKGSSTWDHDVGSNCPATKVTNVGIGVTYSGSSIASATSLLVAYRPTSRFRREVSRTWSGSSLRSCFKSGPSRVARRMGNPRPHPTSSAMPFARVFRYVDSP